MEGLSKLRKSGLNIEQPSATNHRVNCVSLPVQYRLKNSDDLSRSANFNHGERSFRPIPPRESFFNLKN